jgi:hypothetical protein
MGFAMMAAPTAELSLQVFLDWGNMCDAPWPWRTVIADILRRACREARLVDLLPPDERDFFEALPPLVCVWRGCEGGRERGVSWTTDQAIATQFAWGKRFINKVPTLVRAEIPKQHIFAVFTSRQESELALDYRRLRKLYKAPAPGA